MSFSLGPLSNCSGTLETNILAAQSLGTAANHIPVAYIDSIIPAPPFNEDLQTTCSFGNTTNTGIVVSAGNVEVSANDIIADLGDITATAGNINAGVDITAAGDITAGVDITAVGEIVSGIGIRNLTGDIVSEKGKVSVGVSGNLTSATGNIINYGSGSIIAEQGHVRAFTYIKADTQYIEATLGNIDSKVGFIQGQQLKMNNFVDGGTSQAVPQLPPFASTPDMTGKTKGCFWVYGPATVIQFIVQTGIPDCCKNASTFIAINQYNTSNPRYLVNYRIAQVGIGAPDYSKLVVSVEFDAPVVITDPVRVCLMVIPD
jgi:hypothetical protein